jgi:hypothetical protein
MCFKLIIKILYLLEITHDLFSLSFFVILCLFGSLSHLEGCWSSYDNIF